MIYLYNFAPPGQVFSSGLGLFNISYGVHEKLSLTHHQFHVFATLLILGAGTVVSKSIGDTFIRNTLRFNGASVGYRSGFESEVKLNDISRQAWGILQHDGAGIQAQVKRQTNMVLEQNWIHFSPKYGLRFDGEPPKIGRHGTMKQNVVRKTNGVMVKGDYHTVDHNLIFHKFTKAGDHDGQGNTCTLCVLRLVFSFK